MSAKHPGSRHHKALGNRRWALLRLRIFERDGWRCVKCGKAGRLECDHIVSMETGGDAFDPANLQTLCVSCHIEKTLGERSPPDPERERWRAYLVEVEHS